MCKHAEREHGLQDIFEIMLESIRVAECGEYLRSSVDGNKGNGYRLKHLFFSREASGGDFQIDGLDSVGRNLFKCI